MSIDLTDELAVDSEIRNRYGMTLRGLHGFFVKKMRRYGKASLAVMSAEKEFVCGFIWVVNPDKTVSARCFSKGSNKTPLVIEYTGIDGAWEEYKKLVLDNL